MSRGVAEFLTELPTAVVVGFAVITQLGDFWFVSTASVLAYWLGSATPVVGRGLSRERAAMVVTAAAVTLTLKSIFAFPRPPADEIVAVAAGRPWPVRPFYESVVTGRGYGFPGGHATTAVLVWGGFAWALRVGRARQRYAVAGAVSLGTLAAVIVDLTPPDVVVGVLAAVGIGLVLALPLVGERVAEKSGRGNGS